MNRVKSKMLSLAMYTITSLISPNCFPLPRSNHIRNMKDSLQNQGMGKAALVTEALGENLLHASYRFWWLLTSLVCGHITKTSAFVLI